MFINQIKKDQIVTEDPSIYSHLLCKSCSNLLTSNFMQCHKCESLICSQCFANLNKQNYQCNLEENCNSKNFPQMPLNWQKNDIINKISQILVKCASSLNHQTFQDLHQNKSQIQKTQNNGDDQQKDHLLQNQNKILNQSQVQSESQQNYCGSVLHFANYEKHCQNCDLIKVKCTNVEQGCKAQVLKADLEKHVLDFCVYAEEQCEFCGQKNLRRDLKIHEKVCRQRVQCQICQEYVGIQRVEQHRVICEQARKDLNASNQMINFMIMQLKELNEDVLQDKFVSTMQILSEFMKQQEEKQNLLFQDINNNKIEQLDQINHLNKEILELQSINTSFQKENKALEMAIIREQMLKQSQMNSDTQLSTSDYSDQIRVDDPLKGNSENMEVTNIIINKIYDEYEQTRKMQRQLKKQCLRQANEKCESPNYWTDWKKFTKQCGELINEQQQQKFHDPLGFMFSNQCYNCYIIYQKYKEEEKRQGYSETLENYKQQIESLGGDLKDLKQRLKQKSINSSSYSQLNQSIKQQ